jgi:hypothetical protein
MPATLCKAMYLSAVMKVPSSRGSCTSRWHPHFSHASDIHWGGSKLVIMPASCQNLARRRHPLALAKLRTHPVSQVPRDYSPRGYREPRGRCASPQAPRPPYGRQALHATVGLNRRCATSSSVCLTKSHFQKRTRGRMFLCSPCAWAHHKPRSGEFVGPDTGWGLGTRSTAQSSTRVHRLTYTTVVLRNGETV